MWLRFERVPEEDEKINLALGDLCPDFHIAAKRAGGEAGNNQVKLFCEQFTGGASGKQNMAGQGIPVKLCPFKQV